MATNKRARTRKRADRGDRAAAGNTTPSRRKSGASTNTSHKKRPAPALEELTPSKRIKFGASPIFTFYVGPRKEPFHIHRVLLCEICSDFNAWIHSSDPSSQTDSIALPNQDTQAFEVFTQWAYSNPEALAIDRDVYYFERIFAVYVLADRLSIRKLKHELMDKLLATGLENDKKEGPPLEDAFYVYENLPDGSPLRKAVVDWYAWYFDWEDLVERRGELAGCPEFVLDCTFALFRAGRIEGHEEMPLTMENRCAYHEHTPEEVQAAKGVCPDSLEPS